MLQLFLQPLWFIALCVWSFAVLSAAQLTIRLIMAYSPRLTLLAALVVAIAALPIAYVYDLLAGSQPPLTARLSLLPLPMLLMAIVGFLTARYVLKIRRTRGQLAAAVMVGLLDPHLFALLSLS